MTIYLRPEITQLSQGLDIDLPDSWLAMVERYLPAMKKYLEYQVSLSKKELSIITLGRDDAFLAEIESHLEDLRVSGQAISIFRRLRRQVTRATWGVKLLLGPEPEIQVYVKKPLPLEAVLSGLRAQGYGAAVAQQIKKVASILEKSYTHFFGADFTPGQPVPFQIYFTQYLSEDASVLRRMEQVVRELALPSHVTEQLIQAHTLLSQPKQTIWISLSLVDGSIYPAIKLDYRNITFGLATRLLETLQLPSSTLDALQMVAETLNVQAADYMGLRLAANAAPSASIYLTRIR